ncbi:unnamed protein product [Amoebophrya sp. A25]|nr:unnamed protein product [Amoebophrya sp. A25]|eukprot:GSA25T00005165001.1
MTSKEILIPGEHETKKEVHNDLATVPQAGTASEESVAQERGVDEPADVSQVYPMMEDIATQKSKKGAPKKAPKAHATSAKNSKKKLEVEEETIAPKRRRAVRAS